MNKHYKTALTAAAVLALSAQPVLADQYSVYTVALTPAQFSAPSPKVLNPFCVQETGNPNAFSVALNQINLNLPVPSRGLIVVQLTCRIPTPPAPDACNECAQQLMPSELNDPGCKPISGQPVSVTGSFYNSSSATACYGLEAVKQFILNQCKVSFPKTNCVTSINESMNCANGVIYGLSYTIPEVGILGLNAQCGTK